MQAAGPARRIPIETPAGRFEVWTRTYGANPAARVLLLHGGPGATHEYLRVFAERLPERGFEVILYDQLGSFHSDQPDAPELWTIDRFVDEVEQVRLALDLDRESFFLYGQSWGGMLAIEYALEHQRHLKGLIISNMMSSNPAYNEYAETVLKPAMDPDALAEIEALEAAGDFENPRYEELLLEHHYVEHFLRRPPESWPADVLNTFGHINKEIYVPLQGPSELGMSGTLATWDRSADLHRITVPTLVIGARHDTMDPEHMRWMTGQFPRGRHLHLPEGSHLAMYDDSERYFAGLIEFLEEVTSEFPRGTVAD